MAVRRQARVSWLGVRRPASAGANNGPDGRGAGRALSFQPSMRHIGYSGNGRPTLRICTISFGCLQPRSIDLTSGTTSS
jgi:hypothetical protein